MANGNGGNGGDANLGESKYFQAFDPNAPQTDRFKYDAFLSEVGRMAKQTKKVVTPSYGALLGGLAGADPRMWAMGSALGGETKALRQQAEKAASALELKGAGTAESMRKLHLLESETREQKGEAELKWGDATKQAEEYVLTARQRSESLLGELRDINADIASGRETAKAHAMQAGVQATLGSLGEERRAVEQLYGKDSPEYQRVIADQRTSLGTLNSNITTSFQKLREEQGINYLNLTGATGEKMAMYVNYAEQQHVETLMATAQYSQTYDLQTSQFFLNVEQFRMAGMDDMANWIAQTPVFMLDITPAIALYSEISGEIAAKQQIMDERLEQRRIRKESSREASRARMWAALGPQEQQKRAMKKTRGY